MHLFAHQFHPQLSKCINIKAADWVLFSCYEKKHAKSFRPVDRLCLLEKNKRELVDELPLGHDPRSLHDPPTSQLGPSFPECDDLTSLFRPLSSLAQLLQVLSLQEPLFAIAGWLHDIALGVGQVGP